MKQQEDKTAYRQQYDKRTECSLFSACTIVMVAQRAGKVEVSFQSGTVCFICLDF